MNRGRLGVAAVAIAPAVLLIAFVWHPYLPGRQPNVAAIAAAVSAGPTRWALAHLATTVGAVLLIVAFLAIDRHLRDLEPAWRSRGLALMISGTALYAVLPGMEFAPLAAAESGGDVQGAQTELLRWFVPVIAVAALTSVMGAVRFAAALRRTHLLPRQITGIVAGALIVMTAARFVPFAVVQFYVQGVAGLVALWPLAFGMSRSWSAATRLDVTTPSVNVS